MKWLNTMTLRYDRNNGSLAKSPAKQIWQPWCLLILAIMLLPAWLSADYVTHKVEKGENCYRIGLKYGVTADQIKELNGLTGDFIEIGQVLKIKEKVADKPAANVAPAPPQAPQGAIPTVSEIDYTKLTLPEDFYYTVVAGDNLFRIAINNQLVINNLIQWNNLGSDAYVISPGDRLIVKDPSTFTEAGKEAADKVQPSIQSGSPAKSDTLLVESIYVVKKKDTLFSIAKANGMTVDDLKALNKLSSNDIFVGQKIWLAGTPPEGGAGQTQTETGAGSDGKYRTDCFMPTQGRVTSEFGMRRGRPHKGIDIANKSGTHIHAVLDGTVVFSGVQRGYGNVILIEHPNFVMTVYAHAEKNLVKVGDRVSRGQHISNMGSTGNSTGPHLHFEYRVKGTAINPRKVLPF